MAAREAIDWTWSSRLQDTDRKRAMAAIRVHCALRQLDGTWPAPVDAVIEEAHRQLPIAPVAPPAASAAAAPSVPPLVPRLRCATQSALRCSCGRSKRPSRLSFRRPAPALRRRLRPRLVWRCSTRRAPGVCSSSSPPSSTMAAHRRIGSGAGSGWAAAPIRAKTRRPQRASLLRAWERAGSKRCAWRPPSAGWE